VDKLEKIFKLQDKLNKGYFDKFGMQKMGHYPPSLWEFCKAKKFDLKSTSMITNKNESPAVNLRRYSQALLHEIMEVEDAALYKFWDKEENVDWDEVRRELVDCLHFFVSMCQCAGMDANMLHEMYEKKHAVNEQRRDSNDYSSRTKPKGEQADDAHIKSE